jgi:hypothetical protein
VEGDYFDASTSLEHHVMYLQPLLEGDLPQSLMDRFRQVQARLNNGGSFGLLTGRAGHADPSGCYV